LDLNDAYAVKTPQDSRKLYADWAATYDETFVKANAYVYPRTIAEHFDRHTPTDQIKTVVDIGCGTGVVGKYLSNLRHQILIDGFDISPEMLTQASALKRLDGSPVYRDLIEVDLTQEMTQILTQDRTVDVFDSMISAGTFTHGHLGPKTLVSLINLVRIGGWLVIGINAMHFSSQGFAEALGSAVESKTISAPTYTDVQIYGPTSPHFGDLARIATFQRTA